jgi:5-methylcytosine-specific restriction endonuclease McrA
MKYSVKDLDKLGHSAAKKYAKQMGISRTTKKVRVRNVPECSTRSCQNPCIEHDWHWTTGRPVFRSVCFDCYKDSIQKRNNGLFGNALTAERLGISITELTNSRHPYRKYRKTFCENTDGRLGYTCTATIHWDGMLDVDHIDGDPSNNNPKNLQTLCKNCHSYKTNINEDSKSPGRKLLGITY